MNKIWYAVIIAILFIGISFVLLTVVNAKSLNLFCSKKQTITVILKNEADIEKSKNAILKTPQIKITKIQYRDEEWSRMVNKMDLPKMENPFKNEFTIMANKKANMEKVCDEIKKMSFVEDVKCVSDKKGTEK